MFTFPALAILIASVSMTAVYFALMLPRWNLSLVVFLLVSLTLTAIQIALYFTVSHDWAVYGIGQCVLYDVGASVQLMLGKRHMRDVIGKR